MTRTPDSDAPPSAEVRALVVDDDATNRRVLELILESKGVEAASAVNGSEAVAAFREGSFDVVLMDLQMPVMDGFAAIREIRSFEAARQAPRTPVVVVSAYTRGRDLELSAAAGADLHLGKPVDVRRLLGAIEALTGHWTVAARS